MSDTSEHPTRTRTVLSGDTIVEMEIPICGAPCHYGGLSATRKYSKSELGWMWHCNRQVKVPGTRCYQHRSTPSAVRIDQVD